MQKSRKRYLPISSRLVGIMTVYHNFNVTIATSRLCSSFSFHFAEMSGFRWNHQKDILKPYTDRYFESIKDVFANLEKELAQSFAFHLFPDFPEDETILQRTEALLQSLDPKKDKLLMRFVKESIDDLKRSKKCIDLVLKDLKK